MGRDALETTRIVDPMHLGLAGLSLLTMLTVTACAPERDDESNETSRGTTPSGAIAVQYDDKERTSDGPFREHIDLVVAGDDHVRVRIRATGMASMLYVWDGTRLLRHSREDYRPWSLYESADQHPDQLEVVTEWRQQRDSAAFEKGCRSARVVGHKKILGRSAVGYHCAAVHNRDGSSMSAFVQWRDATGLLLQAGNLHATAIDDSPRVSGETFSTRPPTRAKVAVHAAKPEPGQARSAPDFHLKKLSGGTVGLSDFAGRPLVLAFFSSDIVFDTQGEECRRCLPAMLALQRDTSGGTEPAVLAVQGGEKGKPGDPLVPEGLHLVVANDPGFDVQLSYGLSGLVGFAFIGSDGKIDEVFDTPPTDAQLRAALKSLD